MLSDIDRLITIAGMVIRCSNPMPEMREGLFMCAVCLLTEKVELDRGRLEEPTLCSNCNTKHSFELLHNRCHFINRQVIKLQEAPGNIWFLIQASGYILVKNIRVTWVTTCFFFFSFFRLMYIFPSCKNYSQFCHWPNT